MAIKNYIPQLRRGWKWDSDPETGQHRDDWAEYEAKEDHTKPLEGEPVLEYDNGIPRLKIGNGEDEFSALPYISVDSFILPKPISVTLEADKWKQVSVEDEAVVGTYSQVVTVDNAIITVSSKVDLQPDANQLCSLYRSGIALTTENDGGTITVYAVGGKPTESYTIQATVTEILLNAEVGIDE